MSTLVRMLLAATIVAIASGCIVEAKSAGERPRERFLQAVRPKVQSDLWSNDELVKAGRQVCAQLDLTDGDKYAVFEMLTAGISGGDDPEVVDKWVRDVSTIEAGALTYFCPRWAGLFE